MTSTALSHIRICDFTGQLAGAGATRMLAAFGAQVIRIEDPVQPRAVGHPPRRPALRRRPPGHRLRRRVQQPQRREARHHPQPAHRARQGARCASWSRSPTSSPRTSPPACSPASASPTRSCRRSGPTSSTCRTGASATAGPYSVVQDVGPDRAGGVRAHLHVRAARPAAGRLGLLVHGPHGGNFMAIAILAALLPPQPHRRGPVGRHGVHRGRHHARRARRCSTTR